MIDTVVVGPITYKVVETKDLHAENSEGVDRSLAGHVLYSDEVIKVESELSDKMKLHILLHEATHAMLYQGGLDDVPESVSLNLGYSLYSFIRDNPELIKMVQGK